ASVTCWCAPPDRLWIIASGGGHYGQWLAIRAAFSGPRIASHCPYSLSRRIRAYAAGAMKRHPRPPDLQPAKNRDSDKNGENGRNGPTLRRVVGRCLAARLGSTTAAGEDLAQRAGSHCRHHVHVGLEIVERPFETVGDGEHAAVLAAGQQRPEQRHVRQHVVEREARHDDAAQARSEERRVGKECRTRWEAYV